MVRGTVVDDKGAPVEGAKITIEMSGGTGRRFETKSDKKGEYIQIGLASGSVPKRLLRDFPELEVDVVEIDPEVVRVTEKYFGLAPDPRLTVHVGDGRVFLKRTDRRYDLILVDAYAATRYGLVIPRHLATKEFLEEARDRLTANGVLMYNAAKFPRLAASSNSSFNCLGMWWANPIAARPSDPPWRRAVRAL